MRELKYGDYVSLNNSENGKYGQVIDTKENGVLVSVFDDNGDYAFSQIIVEDYLEYLEPVHIGTDELKALLCADVTLAELLLDTEVKANYVVDGNYDIKAEDILKSLKHFVDKENCTYSEIQAYVDTVTKNLRISESYDYGSYVRVERLRRPEDIIDVDEKGLIYNTFQDLAGMSENAYPDAECSKKDMSIIEANADELSFFIEDGGSSDAFTRRHSNRVYSVYVYEVEKNGGVDSLPKRKLSFYRTALDRLADAEDYDFMSLKASYCYTGNRVYEQDYTMSRDLYEKCYKLRHDTYVADSLGYIYYYGRVDDRKPDYEKAYQYFCAGAVGGSIESKYKIADIYLNGYLGEVRVREAYDIVSELYHEIMNSFVKGWFDCKFADVALRMGYISEKIAEMKPDIAYGKNMDAYGYFLEAEFAIKRRLNGYEQFGDRSVLNNILKAKKRVLEKLGRTGVSNKTVHLRGLDIVRMLLHQGKLALNMTITENYGGTKIKLVPVDAENGKQNRRMLLTLADCDYCGFSDQIVLKLNPDAIVNVYEHCVNITALDEDSDGRYWLYSAGRCVGTIENVELTVSCPTEKKRQSTKRRFVGVIFEDDGNVYDYLLEDDMDVEVGDLLIVDTPKHGEQIVKAVNVFESCEDENALPMRSYKTVLRKY